MSAPADFDPCLLDAAAAGRVDDVVSIARQRPDLVDAVYLDIDDADEWEHCGQTPMHVAAEHGHTAVIEALVQLGSTALDRPDDMGETPMHYAVQNGHSAVVEKLVELGSTALDQPDNDGRPPMHHAAQNGHADVIETLHRLGSTATDLPDNIGQTPLMLAVEFDQLEAAEMLVAAGADLTSVELPDDMQPLRSLSADRVAALRLRMFFSRSLVDVLLTELEQSLVR